MSKITEDFVRGFILGRVLAESEYRRELEKMRKRRSSNYHKKR